MNKVITICIIIFFSVIIWLIVSSNKLPINNQATTKIKVFTTNYPSYYFASVIGGDKVEVSNITPLGVDPHDFEPTPRDILNIINGDLLFLRGDNFEPWGEKVITSLGISPTKVIKLNNNIGNGIDPHTWLDPKLAIIEAEIIRDALITTDQINKDYYLKRTGTLIEQLNVLDQEFTSRIRGCRLNTVVTTHSSLNYLAKKYGFNVNSILGVDPEGEPSPKKIIELIDQIKSLKIKYLLTEPLLTRKYAETLSRETGIIYLIFNPLESLFENELPENKNYFTVQVDNLRSIITALECR